MATEATVTPASAEGTQGANGATGALRPGTEGLSLGGLRSRTSVRNFLWIAIITVIVLLGSIFLLFPVAFMIVTSLKTSGGAFLLPMKWLPGIQYAPQWQNYPDALKFMKWQTAFGNTIFIAALAMIGDVVSATLVAYGFARFRAPGRSFLFVLVLATLMVPYVVRLVPEYLGFARMGMVNTYWPLILPPFFGAAFNIFLLRQFFTTIPVDMDESAKLDGAGPIRILWDILVPQMRPALAVVMIGSFTFNWNDFLRPLIYINGPALRTSALALASFQSVYGGTPYHLLMAASLVTMLPLLLLFFFLQRYFIQGIVITGVKG
jgi:ABC-type glycerol-3-phosphate transport system permease component